MASFAESLLFLSDQTGFAIQGMAAFVAGAASAWIVIHWEIEALQRFPLWVLKWVTRLIGRDPNMVRLFVVICGFNSVAMFLYMSTGVWVVLPALVCFLTGMNLAIIFVRGRPAPLAEPPDGEEVPAADDAADGLGLGEGVRLKVLPLLCGLLVLVLELPAFWYSIGMGISLGHVLRDHYSLAEILFFSYNSPGIGRAFAQRGAAYLHIIVPVLAVSALAEAYSVSEASKMVPWGERWSDEDSGGA